MTAHTIKDTASEFIGFARSLVRSHASCGPQTGVRSLILGVGALQWAALMGDQGAECRAERNSVLVGPDDQIGIRLLCAACRVGAQHSDGKDRSLRAGGFVHIDDRAAARGPHISLGGENDRSFLGSAGCRVGGPGSLIRLW